MRMSSAITALKTKAPSLGGSFAVWGGLYSSFDCTFAYLRGKEDFKNSIMSGAATGAVLAARSTSIISHLTIWLHDVMGVNH